MKRYITYEEKDLRDILTWIKDRVEWIKSNSTMMVEQADGKRSNIDMGIGRDILSDVLKIEEALKTFHIDLDRE